MRMLSRCVSPGRPWKARCSTKSAVMLCVCRTPCRKTSPVAVPWLRGSAPDTPARPPTTLAPWASPCMAGGLSTDSRVLEARGMAGGSPAARTWNASASCLSRAERRRELTMLCPCPPGPPREGDEKAESARDPA